MKLLFCAVQEEDKFSIDPPCLKDAMVSCVGMVDDSRCLLGDIYGKLFMLFVEKEERMEEDARAGVTGLRLETLGEVLYVCTTYLCIPL